MHRAEYVMFGHSSAIGDLIEVIHSHHDLLVAVVCNVPEPLRRGRPDLASRLSRLMDRTQNPLGVNGFYPITVTSLDQFSPSAQQKFVIGFSGLKMQSLRTAIKTRWGVTFSNLIHSTAWLAADAIVGEGLILQAGAVVSSRADIGDHAWINKGAHIGRNAVIRSFAVIGPGVRVGARAEICEGAYVGIGAHIADGVFVGHNARIGAGAEVCANVPAGVLVAGRPAVFKKVLNRETSYEDGF